jgi:MATE family multidrug resistance protein
VSGISILHFPARKKTKEEIPDTQEVAGLLRLATPLVIAQVAQMAMGVVGTLVAGQLGVRQLAAQGLGATAFSLILIMGFGLMAGLDPHIARASGAQDPTRAGRLFQQGLWTATFAALPLGLLIAFAGIGLRWMGQEPKLMDDVDVFLHWSAIGILPALWFAASRSFLSAIGQPRLIMLSAVAANVAHAGLCVWLGLGGLGVPALGIKGIALAAVLGRTLMFLLLWAGQRFSPPLKPYRAPFTWPEWPLLRTVLRSGLPLALQYGLEASSFALVTFWMGLLGEETLAAHEVALNIVAMAFQVPYALSMAGAMRVGQAVGRRDEPGIARAGWMTLRVALVYAVLSGTVIFLLRAPLAGIYLPHAAPEVLGLTWHFLAIAAAFQVADGAQAVGFGVLRGLDDTRVPVLFNLLGFSVLGLPLGYWQVFVRHQGAAWLWWGLSLGLGVAALLLALRFWMLLRRRRA